jgi:L-fuculose-phosphate aldolase
MSVRTDTGILITKSGAPLGFLDETLLIEGRLDIPLPGASMELPVHQAIYRNTDAGAVIHAHPTCAVVLSFFSETVIPADSEGGLLLGRIPVIIDKKVSAPQGIADAVSEHLKNAAAVIVQGHGTFVRGITLEEAFSRTSTLEASCRVLYKLMILRKR